MRPIFSFLIWWRSPCAWNIPSGCRSSQRLLRRTTSISYSPSRRLPMTVTVLCCSSPFPLPLRASIPRSLSSYSRQERSSCSQSVSRTVLVGASQAKSCHRPAEMFQGCAGDTQALHNGRVRHRKCPRPSLKMIVAENGTADDGKVGVRSDEHAGKEREEVAYAGERRPVDVHRSVFLREDDAVVVVVDKRGELHVPSLARQFERNDAVVAALRVSGASLVTGVLGAEQAFGITILARLLSCGADVSRILLGLGAVDGDLYLAELSRCSPLPVL